MAIKEFDVFVIGTGNAGKHVALTCRKAGKKVAIADNSEYGGTCANEGCDPKKVLVGLTEIIERSENMLNNGLTKLPKFSWEDLQQFKLKFTDAVPFVNERNLKEAGIKLYHQSPKFLDSNSLSVEGKTIKAKKIVIATGQKPLLPHFEGAHSALTSKDFLALEKLPKSMVFIGGGYVGMELAHVAARFGVKVTVIHSHERPLNNFDPDMVDELVKVSKDIGIKFIFNARAHKIEKLQKYYRVSAQQNGKTVSTKAEQVYMAIGRVPAIEELQLDKGGVSYSKKGIIVNSKLQNPKNKDVYACGDVSDSNGLPLTPLSHYESLIVASQLLDEKEKKELDYPPQPSVVFTLPNLASIGVSEKEANTKNLDVIIKKKDATTWYSAKHLNAKVYAFKTIIDKKSGKILGAHLIGSGIDEIINLFSLAMANNLTANDLKKTIYAYPTWGIDIKSML